MYSKECYFSIFGDGCRTTYYKDGKKIAYSKSDGIITFVPSYTEKYSSITRAKAYRYWEKYFPNRVYWDLPKLLEDAIDLKAELKCVKDGIAYYG